MGLAVAAVASGIWLSRDQTPLPETVIAVSADDSAANSSERMIFANGLVEGRGREAKLQFEIAGRLAQIEVAEGDLVRRGQTLARLDRSILAHEAAQAEARREQTAAERIRLVNGARRETRDAAQAEVRAALARMTQARATFERAAALANSRTISRQEFDDAQGEFETARAAYEAALARAAEIEAPAREDEIRIADAKVALAEAEWQAALAALDKTELKSPTDGLILRIDGELGETVGPEALHSFLTMVDNSQVRVRAFVEELDALSVTPGQTASIEADGLPDLRFSGRVVECAPSMVSKTLLSNRPGERVDVKVREVVILLDRQDHLDRLVVGLPVEVFIQPRPKTSTSSTLAQKAEEKR